MVRKYWNFHLLWFNFAFLRYTTGNQKQNLTLIVIRSHTYSHASRQLQVFASKFDWFTGLSISFGFV